MPAYRRAGGAGGSPVTLRSLGRPSLTTSYYVTLVTVADTMQEHRKRAPRPCCAREYDSLKYGLQNTQDGRRQPKAAAQPDVRRHALLVLVQLTASCTGIAKYFM
jgi:hypothetical protein